MDHPLVDQMDALDVALGNSADITPTTARKVRDLLSGARTFLARNIVKPQPGSTFVGAGAPITHRPDLAYDERVRQAAAQGDAGVSPGLAVGVEAASGYLPVKRAIVGGGAGGTRQASEPGHPAEVAPVGGSLR